MVSSAWVVSRAVGAETLTCSHCGSAALYPYPGLLGELGTILHRVRYACRECHRSSWLSPDADAPQAPPDEPELEVPGPPKEPAALDALDVDMAPLPPPVAATDLTALDEQLARERRRRKKR